MDYTEFRRHLGKAGVTVGEFAGLLDIRPESVSNYSVKEAVPPTYAALAVMLGDAADNGHDFRTALARFDIPKRAKKARTARKVTRMDDYRGRGK